MSKNEILLDTCIIRDCIREIDQKEQPVTTLLNKMKHDNEMFCLSDLTWFELIDAIERKEITKEEMLKICTHFDVNTIYKKDCPEIHYQHFEMYDIATLKKCTFASFAYTMVNFISDIADATSVGLINTNLKIKDETINKRIQRVLNINDACFKSDMAKILENTYIQNKYVFRKNIDLILKHYIVAIFVAAKYINDGLIKQGINFSEYVNQVSAEIDVSTKNMTYLQYCRQNIKSENIKFYPSDNVDMDYVFAVEYTKYLLNRNTKYIEINDAVDFINFKYGMVYCKKYITSDKDEIKLYEELFSDNIIRNYIDDIMVIDKKIKYSSSN